jgi:hypothetical protein
MEKQEKTRSGTNGAADMARLWDQRAPDGSAAGRLIPK